MPNSKLLKLPSQRQLVDRLLHLIEFSHPFIFLSGKPGSGRATLCESLLGQLPEKVRVVSLIGTPAMKMVDVRQLLLPQVVAHPLFNPHDALADSFFRMLEGSKPVDVLLLVEQADQLPAELLGELWAISCYNDTLAAPHLLTIIVSGSDDWCRTQRSLLKGRAMPALELNIPSLSPPEQRIFLYEKAKELQIPATFLPKLKVEEILAAAKGHPSTIMQLLEDVMTDRRPKKRQAELPIKKIATVIAVLAGGLLAMSYLLPLLFDNDSKSGVQNPTQLTPLPPPVSQDDPLTAGGSDDPVAGDHNQGIEGSTDNPLGIVKDWQPETKDLPKLVEGETVTTESTNYEGRRVVISDEVVQKLLNESNVSEALPTDVIGELTGKSQTQTRVVTDEVAGGGAQTAKTAANAFTNKPVTQAVKKAPLTPVETLNKKPRNHYSIQLIGASNAKKVDQFVAEHALAGQVWIYRTKFRGGPWYVVLKGDYVTLAQAKSAIRQLSPALLKEQPWPKSFAQIQKELKS